MWIATDFTSGFWHILCMNEDIGFLFQKVARQNIKAMRE